MSRNLLRADDEQVLAEDTRVDNVPYEKLINASPSTENAYRALSPTWCK